MPALPQFEACLICDALRPEMGGKLILLGFFGVCPNVDVRLPYPDQPTILTFLFSGGPGEGTFKGRVAIVDESDQRVIAETGAMPFIAQQNVATTLAPTLMVIFGHPGLFTARLFLDETVQFRGEFRVNQAASPSPPA